MSINMCGDESIYMPENDNCENGCEGLSTRLDTAEGDIDDLQEAQESLRNTVETCQTSLFSTEKATLHGYIVYPQMDNPQSKRNYFPVYLDQQYATIRHLTLEKYNAMTANLSVELYPVTKESVHYDASSATGYSSDDPMSILISIPYPEVQDYIDITSIPIYEARNHDYFLYGTGWCGRFASLNGDSTSIPVPEGKITGMLVRDDEYQELLLYVMIHHGGKMDSGHVFCNILIPLKGSC